MAKFLKETPSGPQYVEVRDVNILFGNYSEGDARVGKHGFLPGLSGVSGEFLDGNGAWATPATGVLGPVSAVVGHLAAFATADGQTIADSGFSAEDLVADGYPAALGHANL